ncbi:hypothetical protein [Sphingomonas horti]
MPTHYGEPGCRDEMDGDGTASHASHIAASDRRAE